MIKNEQHAKEYAKKFLGSETLVVGANGDIHADCNIDEVCKMHEESKEEYFILKGERVVSKPKNDKNKKDDK